MKKTSILIDKKTGNVITVFDEVTAPLMEQLGTLSVERVSNIDFNNGDQQWQARTRDENKDIIVSGTPSQKKEVYSKEAEWANENIEALADKHFPDKTVSLGE